MTFVFTGRGNVSKGAQEVFRQLPHEMVTPEDLAVLRREGGDPHKVYGSEVLPEHFMRPKDLSRSFDLKNYYRSPEDYESTFMETIFPHTSVGIFLTAWLRGAQRCIIIIWLILSSLYRFSSMESTGTHATPN